MHAVSLFWMNYTLIPGVSSPAVRAALSPLAKIFAASMGAKRTGLKKTSLELRSNEWVHCVRTRGIQKYSVLAAGSHLNKTILATRGIYAKTYKIMQSSIFHLIHAVISGGYRLQLFFFGTPSTANETSHCH